MPSMNIGLQRRVGALPKTPEFEHPSRSGYYGYSHAGFKGRKPTPRYEGFFGIGSGWYGDDEKAQGDLPVNGFYGATGSDDDAMIDAYLNGHYLQGAEVEAAAEADPSSSTQTMMANQVTASEGFVLSNNAMMIGAGLALVYFLSRK